MIIALCGSLRFFKEMRKLQRELEKTGNTVLVPKSFDLLESGTFHKPQTIQERLNAEKKYDFIREHFRKIEQSDAVLVANYDKDGVAGYIGGNTFLEMGIAFYLGKKIYLLYPIPEIPYYSLELHAMRPVILDGDISKLL